MSGIHLVVGILLFIAVAVWCVIGILRFFMDDSSIVCSYACVYVFHSAVTYF